MATSRPCSGSRRLSPSLWRGLWWLPTAVSALSNSMRRCYFHVQPCSIPYLVACTICAHHAALSSLADPAGDDPSLGCPVSGVQQWAQGSQPGDAVHESRPQNQHSIITMVKHKLHGRLWARRVTMGSWPLGRRGGEATRPRRMRPAYSCPSPLLSSACTDAVLLAGGVHQPEGHQQGEARRVQVHWQQASAAELHAQARAGTLLRRGLMVFV